MHELGDELLPPPPVRVEIKRVYAAPAATDGVRVLVDRLWPRGVSKSRAALDKWLPDVAPSEVLRKWFGHDARRWREFRRRYRAELRANGAAVEQLRQLAAKKRVTLLYGAKDEHCNNAAVLAEFLREGVTQRVGRHRRAKRA
jgi:uncharacterized protein YeaO (DUF488 family)